MFPLAVEIFPNPMWRKHGRDAGARSSQGKKLPWECLRCVPQKYSLPDSEGKRKSNIFYPEYREVGSYEP